MCKPIGFGSWSDEMDRKSEAENAKTEVENLDDLYEEKFTKHMNFVKDLTKEVADLTGKYLSEKAKRMYLDIELVDLRQQIEELKQEVETLKNSQKSEK